MDDQTEFARRVTAVLARFLAQNGRTSSAAELEPMAMRLYELVRERGLPRPLAAAEQGEPGGMSDDEVAPLAARVADAGAEPLLADAVRQLVKACFYPEFKGCRNSFRAVEADGSCRRQQLPRVQRRTSGSHCVDCPYWVSLSPEQHERFLAREWLAGPAEFAAHRGEYLPEDFRALRQWLHAAARRMPRRGI